jgi:hypothetical protein
LAANAVAKPEAASFASKLAPTGRTAKANTATELPARVLGSALAPGIERLQQPDRRPPKYLSNLLGICPKPVYTYLRRPDCRRRLLSHLSSTRVPRCNQD